MKKLTTEDFITQCGIIHNHFYDYSPTVYINSDSKVNIICPTHGLFSQRAYNHKAGFGCKKCSSSYDSAELNNAHLKFVKRASDIFENKYDYSKVVYVNARTPVTIICPDHGEFSQCPDNHINKKTHCPTCANITNAQFQRDRVDVEAIIQKAKDVHGDRFDYSKVPESYKGANKKCIIICRKHGDFAQTMGNHVSNNRGCPRCNFSVGERAVEKWLIDNNITYVTQKTFPECINPFTNKKLRFDFYLPNHNTLIEFDGVQHFRDMPMWNSSVEEVAMRDMTKTMYAATRGIRLVRLSKIDRVNEELAKLL